MKILKKSKKIAILIALVLVSGLSVGCSINESETESENTLDLNKFKNVYSKRGKNNLVDKNFSILKR